MNKLREETMTPKQIKAMQAGPELDAAVHRVWHPKAVIESRWCEEATSAVTHKTFWLTWRKECHPSEIAGDVELRPCHKVDGQWIPIPAVSTDGNAMLALLDKVKKDRSIYISVDLTSKIITLYPKGPSCAEWIEFKDFKQLPHEVAQVALLAKLPKGEEL